MHPAYDNVQPHQRKALEDFRASHTYRTLVVGGIARRYTVGGSGPRTLVLLPGAFMEADMWFFVATATESNHRVLALSASLESFTVEGEIAATLAIMDAEDVDTATVVGLSFGGGILQILLQDHPERVEHAVLSHCSDVRSEDSRKLRRLLKIVRFVPEFVFKWLLRRRSKSYPESSKWRDFTRAFFKERIEVIDKKVVLRFLEDVARFEAPDKLGVLDEWRGEILLLSTADDPVSSPRLDALKERYPKARVEILPEGGHHTMFLFPEAYCDVLTWFLGDTVFDA